MQLATSRPAPMRPLLVFIGFVLVADVIMIASVLALTMSGHPINDWFLFYSSGTMVRTGHAMQLYSFDAQATIQRSLQGPDVETMGYTLPAFVAVALAPLTKLSIANSYLVWVIGNLVLLGVLLRLSWGWLQDVPLAVRAVFLACGASVIGLEGILMGQVDLIVLAAFVGCYALLRSDRPFTGGAVLALALAKPHLAAAVVLLLLVTGQRRALAGFAAAGVPLILLPPLIIGPHLLLDQARLLLSFAGTGTGAGADYGVDAHSMINLRGVMTTVTRSSSIWLWLLPLAAASAAALWAAVRAWRSRPPLHAQSWALAFLLPLIYSPHVHLQSLVLFAAAAALYLIASQSSDRPIVEIKYVFYGLIAVTGLWAIMLVFHIAIIAFLVLAAFVIFARRWPEPAVSSQLSANSPRFAAALKAAS